MDLHLKSQTKDPSQIDVNDVDISLSGNVSKEFNSQEVIGNAYNSKEQKKIKVVAKTSRVLYNGKECLMLELERHEEEKI